MVRPTSQLEGSGVEGKRTCPPLSPQWSPLPQLPLAELVFLEVHIKYLAQRKYVGSTIGYLSSMWIFFFLERNTSLSDSRTAIAVNLR